ncbi:hypothetical protein [Achromobacter xylosoxidans]|uniref:hypothetical protein n=1 Tax=Alcaligenes xylosoxydans xylosoxydans TaxID=85698 RepID=UPI0012DBCEF4|nr:hypothetical protein [Achromobacter xylosoxidans]
MLQPGSRAAHHRELQTSITAACRTGAWPAHRRRPPRAAGHVHHHLQRQHLTSAPPPAAASCRPSPPRPAALAPGQRAAAGRIKLLATSAITCSTVTWPAHRRRPPRAAGHVHHHLQRQLLASVPPAAAASCWPRPPRPAAPARGQRAAGGRIELLATSTTTCSTGTWPARRRRPRAAGHVRHHLQHRHLADAPPAAAARC